MSDSAAGANQKEAPMPDGDEPKVRLACEEPLRELDGFISAISFIADGTASREVHPDSDPMAGALRAIARGLARNAAELRKALHLGSAET